MRTKFQEHLTEAKNSKEVHRTNIGEDGFVTIDQINNEFWAFHVNRKGKKDALKVNFKTLKDAKKWADSFNSLDESLRAKQDVAQAFQEFSDDKVILNGSNILENGKVIATIIERDMYLEISVPRFRSIQEVTMLLKRKYDIVANSVLILLLV